MTLREYLEKNNIKVIDFAKKLGINAATISRVANGQVPSLPVAIKIVRETNGKVDYLDLVPERIRKKYDL